ncbi:MAG TPA: DUF1488 family protein [Dongiaceae bacterium]
MLQFIDQAGSYDHIRQDIHFVAVSDGELLTFRATKPALLAFARLPDARPMQLLNIFDAFRGAIELAAQRKFEAASRRVAGLGSDDFQIGPEDLALPSTAAAD